MSSGLTIQSAPGVSSGGTPAGSDKQIQYNASGAFGAEVGFEYDSANNQATIPGLAVTEDLAWTNDISPPQITADQNDYNPTGLATAVVLRLNTDALGRNITGLAGGSDGRVLIIANVGSFSFTLKDDSTSSAAANRFAINGDFKIQVDTFCLLVYDSTSSRWRIMSQGVLVSDNNSWTGINDFQKEFRLSGVISPAQITANQNDYNPTNLATANFLRLSTDASRDITGLQTGASGRIIMIHNIGSFNIVLKDEDVGSTAANRFALNADVTILPDQIVMLHYDSTTSRWRCLYPGSGGGGTPAGSNKQIQYNNSGAFGAEAGFEYDPTTDTLTVVKVYITGYPILNATATPAQITADQNDYNPSGIDGGVLRVSSDASRNITGLAGGTTYRVMVLMNVGSFNIVLKDESTSSSTANRFALLNDFTLLPDSAAILVYDDVVTRWRLVAQIESPLPVARGGTGATTLTDTGVLIGNGTGAVQVSAAGADGQVFKANAAASDPSFQDDVTTLTFIVDGGGATITTGIKGDLEVPFDCTILQATLLADQSGSIVIDIWKDTYANYPPTVADSITASAKPTISSATKSQDSTLTGWTTTITAGQTLRFNVDSVTSLQRVTVSLKVKKT